MKSREGWLVGLSATTLSSSILGIGLVLAQPSVVSAQAAYGSYVGIGPSIGLTDGDNSEDEDFAGVIAVRYRLLEVPLSIRAQALVFSGTTAIVPTVSYDIPLNWQTDAYIGAGYSFSSGDEASPVGNRNSFAIQPGIDYSLPNSNLVVFGNAIIAFDAYRDGGGAAASLQGGVGLRF